MQQKRSNAQLFTSFTLTAFTVVLGLWLNETPAHAVVTPSYLDAKTAPASICYIEMWTQETEESEEGGNPFNAQPSSACTGTLISNNRVLTAAHCIPGIKAADRTLVTCGNAVSSSIKGFAANPDYVNTDNSDDTHDVAVLDLQSPQKTGAKHYVQPMPLAQTADEINLILKGSETCALWGYGRNDDSPNDNSWGTLRGANIDYLTPSMLQTDTGWIESPQDVFIGPSTHAAPGDSGGPIICTAPGGAMVQIASTMIEGKTTVGPLPVYSVHEMTSFNIDWINSQIALDHLPNK